MTAFAQCTIQSEVFSLSWARAARWLALFAVVAAMATPDCCLTGRHLFGAGMDAFGPICRAAR
jgi:hypothetical protein